MPGSLQTTKAKIRKNVIALREQMSPSMRVSYSASIVERLFEMPTCRQADAVLGYMNFGAEFASDVWVARVLADGKRLVLPRVNRHTNQLDLYWVDDLENQLALGSWGIREPIVERCERLINLNEVEFALLPGVAFARNGVRLGYGGGYYDKLLARSGYLNGVPRPVLASAAFALQIVEQIPQEETDIKLEWLVTEQETIAC